MKKSPRNKNNQGPNLLTLLMPYSWLIVLLVLLALFSNGLNLLIPKIIANGIDSYTKGHFDYSNIIIQFFAIGVAILIFQYLQSIVQTYASERVAKDLRERLAIKISRQSYVYIQNITPARLLTNLTSDTDAVKLFISQAIVSMVSSIFLIIGASILMLLINWELAIAVLLIIPIIGGTFFMVLGKVRVLFGKTQGVIDWLNKVINESILGSALIRVLHSENLETDKFREANTNARNIGYQILGYFALLIPIITFVASFATLIILALGGHFVIINKMTLGDFAAFNSYLGILIFPIILIGFMSNVVARASASYMRVVEVLNTEELPDTGTHQAELDGKIELKKISKKYGEKPVLKNVSLLIKPHTKTAIIGPTAAGKTQLLYLLTGLLKADKGTILYDEVQLDEYDKKTLHQQIGLVFQDSIIFNMTLRENIAFSDSVTDKDLQKAIETAELEDFISSLPKKLDTVISERGTSLSGGQKQRVMLARALALNPKILLLDEFTARVDKNTEKKIFGNVQKNYPNMTLVSVTQSIASVENYDQIVLIMDGEILATGTHKELLKKSPEYVQIFQSQRSTSHYELQT
jgi:ATP-binding cassette subfamily B protein